MIERRTRFVGRCRGETAPCGRFCRVIYVPLTITDEAPGTEREQIMRIQGPNGTTLGSRASAVRRTSSGTFSVPEEAASVADSRTISAPMAPSNIDALLALQGIEDPTERRRRSVQRGRGALDVLDDLKLGLLSGNLNAATVNRLRDAAANLKSSSGDPGLDAVLSEIELRVEVELAKAGQF